VRIGTGSYQQCGQQFDDMLRKYFESVVQTTHNEKKGRFG